MFHTVLFPANTKLDLVPSLVFTAAPLIHKLDVRTVPADTVVRIVEPNEVIPDTIKAPDEITLSIKLSVVTLTLTTLPLTYKLDAVMVVA